MKWITQREKQLKGLRNWGMMIAVAGLAACNTTGYRESDAAAWNSQAAAREVKAEGEELDASLAVLSELVQQPAADAKPQFLQFSASLDRLAAWSKRAGAGVDRMWRNRSAYFQIWEKEIAGIGDEEIRKVSATRKTEASNQFDSAARQYAEGQKSLAALVAYLQDIRKALSTDLTRQGLTAAQPSVTNANERARAVKAALGQSAAELDVLSARTASFRVQEVK